MNAKFHGSFGLMLLAASLHAQSVTTVLSSGLYEPNGVACASDTNNTCYIADGGNGNQIGKYSTNGGFVSLAGNPPFSGAVDGAGSGALFNEPWGIVYVPARGGFVVSDRGNQLLRLVTADGVVSTLSGAVDPNGNWVDGPAATAQFSFPSGVAADSRGNVYVADFGNGAIRKLGINNTVSTVVSNLAGPQGIAVSFDTNIWVADAVANVIKLITLDPNSANVTIKVIAGTGLAFHGDNTVALNAFFNQPRGLVWVGGKTGLVVADTGNNSIRSVYYNSIIGGYSVTTITNSGFNAPLGLGYDNEGSILVADSKAGALRAIVRPAQPAPTAAPASGSYSNDVTVNFKTTLDASAAQTFRYTTDGSYPTPFSSSGAFLTISGGAVPVQARNFSPDYATSASVSNYYTFFVNPPVISPAGASSDNPVTVTLTSDTAGAAIYWAIDSDPITNSYTAPFALGTNGTLKVKAFKSGYTNSVISSNVFSLVVADPVITPAGTNANNDVTVNITSDTTNAVIRYTLDGNDPKTNSTQFAGPLTINKSLTLKAIAYQDGFVPSQIVSNVFNLTVADPALLPVNGATSDNPVLVTVTNATTGATNYWTVDNSDPTTNSTVYSGPFFLSNSGTLKVKGFRGGYAASQVVSAPFLLTVDAPAIIPGGFSSNDIVQVTLTNGTAGATNFWTIDGSDPTTNSTRYTGPFFLTTNGTLKAKAFFAGFLDSAVSSAVFNLKVADPIISPSGATSDNLVKVSVTNNAGYYYYTIDGSEPTTNSAHYAGPFDLHTNGTLKVKGLRSGFVDSADAGAVFNLTVGAPAFSPGAMTAIDSTNVIITSTTTNALFHYTLDGSTPTTNSSVVTNLPGAPWSLTVTTNTILSVAASFDGFVAAPVVLSNYFIQVDAPKMTPAGGYFPNGSLVTLAVQRSDAKIYYTVDGSDPTTNALPYPASGIKVDQVQFPLADLHLIKARAFAPNTLPSAMVSGQSLDTNSVGVPRDMVAGAGSTIVVPVVVSLATNQQLRSLIFRLEVSPSTNLPAAPTVTIPMEALPLSANDFVPVAGNSAAGYSASISSESYTNGLTTNGILFDSIATNLLIQNYGVVANVKLKIPASALVGQSYILNVLEVSGTSDGGQTTVPLHPMAPCNLLITNIPYLAGSSSPGSWYNAGDFGDGNLDNADVNAAFEASLGVHTPYVFSDAFNAMDVYPETRTLIGDGLITFLDWQHILKRSLRLETNDWTRVWSNGTLAHYQSAPLAPTPLYRSQKARERRACLLRRLAAPRPHWGRNADQPRPRPVLLDGRLCQRAARLQCQRPAIPRRHGGRRQCAPIRPHPIHSGRLHAHAFDSSLDWHQRRLECAWSLGALASPLQSSNLIGYIKFMVPSAAQAGQHYTLQLLRPGGAADLDTELTMEGASGSAWVYSAPPVMPQHIVSDDWKIAFFGSVTNVNADPEADPDHDGIPNWQEYLAGTNPTNAQSRLDFAGVTHQPAAGSVSLQWNAMSGRVYVVESSPSLTGGQWTAVSTNLLGDGTVHSFIQTNAAGGVRFYRIHLLQQ